MHISISFLFRTSCISKIIIKEEKKIENTAGNIWITFFPRQLKKVMIDTVIVWRLQVMLHRLVYLVQKLNSKGGTNKTRVIWRNRTEFKKLKGLII